MPDHQHITGNDPVEGVDPGGTHSTKPGNPDKSGPAAARPVDQKIEGDDRNSEPKS